MKCRDSFKGGYKRVPQGISVLHNRPRKSANAYTKIPEKTSVDWLVASRKVEPVELHNSTVKEENSIIKEVIRWLKSH